MGNTVEENHLSNPNAFYSHYNVSWHSQLTTINLEQSFTPNMPSLVATNALASWR